MEFFSEVAASYLGRIILGIVIWLVGRKLINLVLTIMEKRMQKIEFDESLHTFLTPLVKMLLQVLLVLTVAATLGIEITTFAAILGAASLAVGLAFQGSLANFAGGVLILILKPFKVGDFIEAAGFSGTVREIQIFHTILQTPDNQKVIIPNADLSNSSGINYSAYDTRRFNLQLAVSYDSDLKLTKEVLGKLAQNHPLILEDPAPNIVVGELGDRGVVFWIRVWAKGSDFWTMRFEFVEQIKEAFDEAGIEIPYQKMDINLRQAD